jgi:hypothetical protein
VGNFPENKKCNLGKAMAVDKDIHHNSAEGRLKFSSSPIDK